MPHHPEFKLSPTLLSEHVEERTAEPLDMSAAAAAVGRGAAAVSRGAFGDEKSSVGEKEDTAAVVATAASPRRPLPRRRRRTGLVVTAATVGVVLVMGTVLTDIKATGGGVLGPSGFLLGWTTAVARKNATAVALRMSQFDDDGDDDDDAAAIRRLAREANEFVLSRRREYEARGIGVNWKIRGVGYLYAKQEVVLAARVVTRVEPSDPSRERRRRRTSAAEGLSAPPPPPPTPTHSVHIYNVYEDDVYDDNVDEADGRVSFRHGGLNRRRRRRNPRDDCHKLTVWVRAYGPEIVAGSAAAVPATDAADCHWRFDFAVSVPGEYGVDAKALIWNGKGRDYDKEQACYVLGLQPKGVDRTAEGLPDDVVDVLFPVHAGFKGFKLYYPTLSCCEICTRLSPYCEAWSSPPHKMQKPSRFNGGCELYYRRDTPPDEIPKSWILGDVNVSLAPTRRAVRRDLQTWELRYGRPHLAEPQMYLGCGWSYWHTLDFPCLSGELDDKVFLLNDTFHVAATDAVDPTSTDATEERPLCGAESELMATSAGRWVQEPFPSDEECLVRLEADLEYNRSHVLAYNGQKPHCWHRESIDRIGLQCIEPNCALIDRTRYWNSRARVSRWMGVWRQHMCDYVEFTDAELQQCVDLKKITKITVSGRSVAVLVGSMVKQRIAPLRMYPNASDPGSTQVTLSTLALLHKTMLSDREVRRSLRALPNATDRSAVYVYNGYYTSSEREPYTHADRMHDLNQIVEEVLVPKGYQPLNIYDMSAAWSYDSGQQRDGMHLVGPPMRMGVTKFFHHLCRDAVTGSRV